MSRANRLERLDAQRLALEGDYKVALVEALRRCAAGSWGLFDHNQDRWTRANWVAMVTDLCDRGDEIDQMRETLGLPSFALHQEFEVSRGPVSAESPGEPKQAKAWLERMAKSL